MAIVTAPRDVQMRVCYSPGFITEATFGTSIGNSNLSKSFQLENRLPVELVRTVDNILECSGQFVVDQQTITRYCRVPLEFYADVDSLGWVLAGALGAAGAPSGGGPYTSALSMLGQNVFILPTTTIAIQYVSANPADNGAIFAAAAVNRVTITARAKERIRVSAELFCKWPVAGSGFSAPACTTVDPLRLDQSAFTVNSINRLAPASGDAHNITNQVIFEYANNIIDDVLAFPVTFQDVQTWQRANERPIRLGWQVQGYFLDSLSSVALTDPRTFYPFALTIGPSGTQVVISSGHAMVTSDDRSTEFVGASRTAHLNLNLIPTLSGSTLPIATSVVTGTSGGFMQSSA